MDDVFSQGEGAEQRDHTGEFLITAAFNKNLLLDPQLMLFVSLTLNLCRTLILR